MFTPFTGGDSGSFGSSPDERQGPSCMAGTELVAARWEGERGGVDTEATLTFHLLLEKTPLEDSCSLLPLTSPHSGAVFGSLQFLDGRGRVSRYPIRRHNMFLRRRNSINFSFFYLATSGPFYVRPWPRIQFSPVAVSCRFNLSIVAWPPLLESFS